MAGDLRCLIPANLKHVAQKSKFGSVFDSLIFEKYSISLSQKFRIE